VRGEKPSSKPRNVQRSSRATQRSRRSAK
jgi:hypothetical protein